jgi:hypothetical protein
VGNKVLYPNLPPHELEYLREIFEEVTTTDETLRKEKYDLKKQRDEAVQNLQSAISAKTTELNFYVEEMPQAQVHIQRQADHIASLEKHNGNVGDAMLNRIRDYRQRMSAFEIQTNKLTKDNYHLKRHNENLMK